MQALEYFSISETFHWLCIVSLVSSGTAVWYSGELLKLVLSLGLTSYLQVYQPCATVFSGCLVSVLFLVR